MPEHLPRCLDHKTLEVSTPLFPSIQYDSTIGHPVGQSYLKVYTEPNPFSPPPPISSVLNLLQTTIISFQIISVAFQLIPLLLPCPTVPFRCSHFLLKSFSCFLVSFRIKAKLARPYVIWSCLNSLTSAPSSLSFAQVPPGAWGSLLFL
ncbi:hypothetical protein mRhiFer1_009627 [Rhinolophus ferrumequinum]|uniref:Uncharacterized protein n=1 Tax=Rhinolophus ferrumequinum TaxID=59479 RepID=A0A7J7ZRF9_RHIFE|nr:hypothetical protein mRhiFer1_009627 [Rhinolophus ferrumequinum]